MNAFALTVTLILWWAVARSALAVLSDSEYTALVALGRLIVCLPMAVWGSVALGWF